MKKFASKAWHGFVAAVTSPEAVKKEKSLAVFIGTRVALSLGASAGAVALVVKILGWS
jgi:hypothetical protein